MKSYLLLKQMVHIFIIELQRVQIGLFTVNAEKENFYLSLHQLNSE